MTLAMVWWLLVTTTQAVPADPADPADHAPAPDTMHQAPTKPSHPWPQPVVALLQCGLGCVVASAFAPTVICSVGSCAALPVLVAYAETWAGDRLGSTRAPLLVPVVTAYATMTTTAALAATVWLISSYNNTPDRIKNPATLGTLVGGGALSTMAVALSYQLSAVPTLPGDDGTVAPEFFNAPRPLIDRAKAAPASRE